MRRSGIQPPQPPEPPASLTLALVALFGAGLAVASPVHRVVSRPIASIAKCTKSNCRPPKECQEGICTAQAADGDKKPKPKPAPKPGPQSSAVELSVAPSVMPEPDGV